MAESESSYNSVHCRSDSDCSSTEASKDLYLSLPSPLLTELSPYCFQPVYDADKEPSISSVTVPTDRVRWLSINFWPNCDKADKNAKFFCEASLRVLNQI